MTEQPTFDDLWKVVLERGPKDDISWRGQTIRGARQRADALCDLHSCESTEDAEVHTIYVDAEKWYTKRKRKTP